MRALSNLETKGLVIADTICHGVQGGLMLMVWLRRWIKSKPWLWVVVFLGVFFGTLPDLIGAYGNLVDHDHWTLYRNAHFGDIKQVLQYVPMYWLHLYLDTLMHGPGHRWWRMDERLWLEVVLWMINLAIIAWLVRTWKTNGKRSAALQPEKRTE